MEEQEGEGREKTVVVAESSRPFEIYIEEGQLPTSSQPGPGWLQRSLWLSRHGTAKELGTVGSQHWFLLPLERRSKRGARRKKKTL